MCLVVFGLNRRLYLVSDELSEPSGFQNEWLILFGIRGYILRFPIDQQSKIYLPL